MMTIERINLLCRISAGIFFVVCASGSGKAEAGRCIKASDVSQVQISDSSVLQLEIAGEETKATSFLLQIGSQSRQITAAHWIFYHVAASVKPIEEAIGDHEVEIALESDPDANSDNLSHYFGYEDVLHLPNWYGDEKSPLSLAQTQLQVGEKVRVLGYNKCDKLLFRDCHFTGMGWNVIPQKELISYLTLRGRLDCDSTLEDGMSGGPVLNMKNEVVGIFTMADKEDEKKGAFVELTASMIEGDTFNPKLPSGTYVEKRYYGNHIMSVPINDYGRPDGPVEVRKVGSSGLIELFKIKNALFDPNLPMDLVVKSEDLKTLDEGYEITARYNGLNRRKYHLLLNKDYELIQFTHWDKNANLITRFQFIDLTSYWQLIR